MRWLIIFFFLSACTHDKAPEVPICQCLNKSGSKDSIPGIIYNFSNGHNMALCKLGPSNKDTIPGSIVYSDFIISECKSDSLVCTFDSNMVCTIEMSDDSLFINQISLMALSPNLDMIYIPWLTHKYYYINNRLVTENVFNTGIKYTPEQILKSFQRIDTGTWNRHAQMTEKQANRMMRLASQMMIGAISGSRQAEYYFYLIKERFKPQNELAKQFEEMERILVYARNKKT